MTVLLVFWNDVKFYLFYLLIGGFLGISSVLFMRGRLRFAGLCKAFFVSATVGFLGGTTAKGLGVSPDFQYVAAGVFGFIGGLGGLFLVVLGARKFGVKIQTAIKDAILVRDAMEDASEAFFDDCSGGGKDGDACSTFCPEKPIENNILMLLVQMDVLTERQAKNLCLGQGEVLLVELHRQGSVTDEQLNRLLVAFFPAKPPKRKAAARAKERKDKDGE